MTQALTYQQRNAKAVSTAGALPPIPAFSVTPFKPFLAALEADTMGKFGTPADGFDAALAPLVAALPQHDVQVATMSKTLLAAAFTPGAIDKTIFAPISARLATVLAAGDSALVNFFTESGTPGSGSGGGSGSGSGGGGGFGGGGGGESGDGGNDCRILRVLGRQKDETVNCGTANSKREEISTFFQGLVKFAAPRRR
jgi:uncharacterized membrane protein YgcG